MPCNATKPRNGWKKLPARCPQGTQHDGLRGLLARYPQAACAAKPATPSTSWPAIDAHHQHIDRLCRYAETFPDAPYRHAVDSLKQERAYGDLIVPGTRGAAYVTYLWLYPDCITTAAALDSLLALYNDRKRHAAAVLPRRQTQLQRDVN